MDHLPVPKDRQPFETSIPYLAADVPFYDRQGWHTFPSRWGYTSVTGIITCREFLSWPHPSHKLQALLQSWMFFGLLDEVFGDLGDYQRHNFVSTSTEGSTATVTTSQLLHYIGQKQTSLKLCHGGSFFGRSIEMESIPEISRIKSLLDRASRQINECDWFAQGRVSFTTLIYIANIRRDERDHSKCFTQSKCIAFDTSETDFTGVKHIDQACRCNHISGPNQQLVDILDTGGIPILSCRRNVSGQVIDLRYIRASPGLQYTAISHLWKDGLGNPFANSLPECQLRRLLDDVQSTSPIIARYGYFGMTVAGTEKAAVALRAVGHFYHEISRHWQTTTTVNVWLDVYCVPVAIPVRVREQTRNPNLPNSATHAELVTNINLTRAESQRLKETAIKRMDATYSWASSTLVLDQELSQITPETDETEFLARLGISAWNTRCWTFQEHNLAQVAAYRCKHGVTFKHVPYGDEPEQMTYWSITKPALPVPFGLKEDLERLTSPFRVVTGGTFWTPAQSESRRSINANTRKFVDAWNAFTGRNTTMPQDLLCIFANSLGLSTGDILKLEGYTDQMKAILAAQKRLPLSLLFIEINRMYERYQRPQTTTDALDSRWIPVPPFRSPLQDRYSGFDMTVLSNGLLLEPSVICSASNVKMVRMKMPAAESSRWLFSLDRVEIGEYSRARRFFISINSERLNLCRRANPESDQIIVLLDSATCPPDELSSESFAGACLLPMSIDTDGRQRVVFVCPLRWAIESSSNSAQGEQLVDEIPVVETAVIDGTHPDILLASDIGSWPTLTVNRNSIEDIHKRISMRTAMWLCVIGAVWFMSQILIGILLGPGYIGKMALAATLGLLPSLLLILFITSTMNLAHRYMQLYRHAA